MIPPRISLYLLAFVLAALLACAREARDPAAQPDRDQPTEISAAEDPQPAPAEPQPPPVEPEVPFVPTPMHVVREMLRLASVAEGDVVYDLGCGDGRIVITAVEERGARQGVCVEIDPRRIAEAREKARAYGVEDRIAFVEADLFAVDLSRATVVTLYLLPEVNLRLRPKLLRELRPGTRIVSHDFHMGDWVPAEVRRLEDHTLYRWIIPAEGATVVGEAPTGTGERR